MSTNIPLIANKLVRYSQKISGNPAPEKKGGFLTFLSGRANGSVIELVAPLPIGTYDTRKIEKYVRIAQEKAFRLYAHWLRAPDEALSSFQTRNPEEIMWGGAVLFNLSKLEGHLRTCKIISFSGLAEVTDEALSLDLGYRLGIEQDENVAKRIVEISQNPVYEEMHAFKIAA